jgi:3-vinyl bacteriochlorophyllide hydratase
MHQLKVASFECDGGGSDVLLMSRPPQPSHHRDQALSNGLYTCCDAQFTFPTDPSFGQKVSLLSGASASSQSPTIRQPLYTPEEKQRRDATPWTLVQGILAPVQFLVFLVSLGLVLRYLATGEGLWIATCSIIIKTVLLYTIMITGSIWERVVFGRYLFAPAFFWEDVFSMLVLALHTAYLAAIIWGIGTATEQMLLVLAAYGSYAINATQFILKLRAARLQDREMVERSLAVPEGAR